MRGGKRAGAGRKPGPQKKQLTVRILPETHREINRRSAKHPSIGALMDDTFNPKPTTLFNLNDENENRN
jgi:hypothetical protein